MTPLAVFPNYQYHSHLFFQFAVFRAHTFLDLFASFHFPIPPNCRAEFDSHLSEGQLTVPLSPPLLPLLTLPYFPPRHSAPVTIRHHFVNDQNFLATLPSLIHIQHEPLNNHWQFLVQQAAYFESQHV